MGALREFNTADLAPYIPSTKEQYMCSAHVAYFTNALQVWMEKTVIELSELQAHVADLNTQNNESDEFDRMSIESEMSFIFSKIESCTKLLNEIGESLDDIQKGTYGFCKKTGEQIGIKRLIAQPTSKYCIKMQEEIEETDTRNNEEDEDIGVSDFDNQDE